MPENKERHSERMARYESVALAIAEQIVQGTYLPGSRLHGRSTLAGLYRVSPETIRRATALLQQKGIIDVKHGSGIYVLSTDQAVGYVQANSDRRDLQRIIDQMHGLMQQQQKITEEMNDLLREVVAATRRN